MKVLIISNMYPNKSNPSYGVFVKNQVDILSKNGFDIKLQVMFKQNNSLIKLFGYLVHYIKTFLKVLFTNNDFIYVHYASLNAPPLLLAKLLKKDLTIVTNIHGSDVVAGNNLQSKLLVLTKMLVQKSTLTIVPSQFYKEIIEQQFNIAYDKISVSPSGGINLQVFHPSKSKSSSKEILIGYVGRIDAGKGWADLLKAFSKFSNLEKYKDVKLIMVGHGKESNDRDILIRKLNLTEKVILKPLLSQSELATVYNEIDVLVFPSYRESLGLVGIEAMACGTPVIGSNIGGIMSYLVEGYNGYLVEPGNIDSIVDQLMLYFSLDKLKLEEIKNNALKTAENYDQNLVNKNLISIFREKL